MFIFLAYRATLTGSYTVPNTETALMLIATPCLLHAKAYSSNWHAAKKGLAAW